MSRLTEQELELTPEEQALFGPGAPYADHVQVCPYCRFRTAYEEVLEAHYRGSAGCDRQRLADRLRASEEQVRVLREALEFYASEGAYEDQVEPSLPTNDLLRDHVEPGEIWEDRGARARAALAETERAGEGEQR